MSKDLQREWNTKTWRIKTTRFIFHTGNCKVEELKLPMTDEEVSDIKEKMIIQVCNDVIVTAASGSSSINVWQMKASRIEHMATAGPSIETAAHITCIKWDTVDSGRLVAGYSNGGFTIYQIDAKKRSIIECASHAARPSISCDQHGVQSIALCEKIVMTCSTNMELSTYSINDQGTARLCHCLIGAMTWEPLTLELYSKGDHVYQAIVCFGMSVGLDSWTIGIQVVSFTPTRIISSRHSSSRTHRYGMHDPIQKISYAHPYVVTSHNNNTMQQYRIRSDQGQRVEIEHVRTLWGHTSSVGAMALDAHIGRLVSGDRAGIKVWNLEGLDDYVVGIENGLCERMEWIGFDSEKIVTVAGNHENNVKVWSFSNSNNK